MTLNKNKLHLPVGHTLKIARTQLGLTQKQMAAGVISTSYYSKVENGQHEIDAESLFKILHAHNYTIKRFEFYLFQEVDARPQNKDIQSFYNKIVPAQNKGNKEALDELFAEVKAKKYLDLDEVTMYDIHVAAAYAWLQGSGKDIPASIKKTAKSKLLKEDWTALSIEYFSTWMMLFDIDECYILINSIINAYNDKHSKTNTVIDEISIDIAVVNYCDYCQLENVDKKYVEEAIKFLRAPNKMPQPSLMGFAILGVYYEALFNHDMKKARMIRDILVERGVGWSIRRSIKKLEEDK